MLLPSGCWCGVSDEVDSKLKLAVQNLKAAHALPQIVSRPTTTPLLSLSVQTMPRVTPALDGAVAHGCVCAHRVRTCWTWSRRRRWSSAGRASRRSRQGSPGCYEMVVTGRPPRDGDGAQQRYRRGKSIENSGRWLKERRQRDRVHMHARCFSSSMAFGLTHTEAVHRSSGHVRLAAWPA